MIGLSPLKVFVVEDEYLLRRIIRENIDWEKIGYSFSGEASDGVLALEAIAEILPDVVITDIEMPFMNGIDLCSCIEKKYPWIKIVILTGHQEFSYARDAVSLGVKEFLIKPLKTQTLIEVLIKIAEEISEEKFHDEELAVLKEREEERKSVLKERFFYQLTHKMVTEKEFKDYCSLYDVDLNQRYSAVAVVMVESLSSSDFVGFELICHKIIDRHSGVYRYYQEYNQIALIATENNREGLHDLMYAIGRALNRMVRDKLGKSSLTGLGECYKGYDGIAESFNDAQKIINYRFLFKPDSIVNYKDLFSRSLRKSEICIPNRKDLERFLQYGKKDDVRFFIEEYYKNSISCSGLSPIYLYHFFIVDLVNVVDLFFQEMFGVEIYEVLEVEKISEKLIGIDDFDLFIKILSSLFDDIIDFRESQKNLKHIIQIKAAKKFISEEYSSPELSLNSISEVAGMSPAHFSAVFRQEVGITYIEYTTEVRINEAKRMLKETSLRSSDIGYRVGYSDPRYFSFLFKKRTGVSPTEYRKKTMEDSF